MRHDNYQCEGQMSIFDLDSQFMKTYMEHSLPITEKISEPCWKRPSESKTRMPIFLDLRKMDGPTQELSSERDIVWLGVDMMPNGGAFLREESAYVYLLTSTELRQEKCFLKVNCSEKPMNVIQTKLSQILEKNPDPKYNLSPRACRGILNRAEKRGKELPELLRIALERQSAFKSEPENLGGGKGILIQNEKTGALSTLNNQSVICFEPGSASRVGNHVYEESTGTLRANAGDNQQAVCYGISPDENPDSNHGGVAIIGKCLNSWDVQSKHIQPEDGIAESLYSGECRGGGGESYVLTTKENQKAVCYGISPFDSNAMKSSNPHSGIYEADTSRTLDLNGGSPACNQGGMAVVQGVDLYNQTVTGDVSKTLNAIKSDSDHVPCIAYGLDRASFNQGQNAQFNFSVDEELSPPIVAKGPGGVLARQ